MPPKKRPDHSINLQGKKKPRVEEDSSTESSQEISVADLAAKLQREGNTVSTLTNLSQSSDSDVPLSDLISLQNLVLNKSAVVNTVSQKDGSSTSAQPIINEPVDVPNLISEDGFITAQNNEQGNMIVNEPDNDLVADQNEIIDDGTVEPLVERNNEIVDNNSVAESDNEIVENEGDVEMADDGPQAAVDNEHGIVADVMEEDDDLFDAAARRNIRTHGLAFIVENQITENRVNLINIGAMQDHCQHCGACLFPKENPSICCLQGKVILPQLPECNPEIYDLLTVANSEFRNHIRMYNAALSFASFQANFDDRLQPGNFVFRIHGTPYHTIAPVHPPPGDVPRNGQTYIVDNATATGLRAEAFPQCNRDTLQNLDRLLREINPLCQAYRMIHEIEQEEQAAADRENRPLREITMVMKNSSDELQFDRRFDAPAANEIAIIFKGDYPEDLPNLRIYSRDRPFLTLSMLHPQTDALVYPLIFQHGELGFQINIPHTDGRHNVSMRQFYAYRMAIRERFNIIMSSGRLTHQYIVDTWARTECSRINFIKRNQRKLRSELYTGLMDQLRRVADYQHARIGRMIILPSTFKNSPRQKYEKYLDAITIFKTVGLPSFFITFTCNPNWPEVIAAKRNFESPNDRPDILCRVFKLKLQQLIDDLTKKQILGVCMAMIYAIEFQKRGLPHAHIVLGVRQGDDVHTADDVDKRVCAELPDEVIEPRLASIVKKNMIHGPCGEANPNSPCMKEGQCQKKYPKAFQEETVFHRSGYPVYRRRDNGRFLIVRGSQIDNRHVVPYNPYLLLKFDGHINIEVCSGQKWIKYLFKYCFKGHDCLSVAFSEVNDARVVDYDECQTYLESRYVSAPEAYWRLVTFDMEHMSHSVTKLPVHMPGQNMVVFDERNIEQVLINENLGESKLTAFFKLNQDDEHARQYLYKEIPLHYSFNKDTKKWMPRQRNIKVTSRLYETSLRDRERYCLRLLLGVKRGPRSFDELKTVDGVEHNSFQEAAVALHLMDNDQDSWNCMEEATHFRMPASLRRLFVTICVNNNVNARNLWEQFAEAMSDDFIRRHRMNNEDAQNAALLHIDYLLRSNNSSCVLLGLPEPRQVDHNVLDEDDNFDAGRQNRDHEDHIHVRDALNERQTLCFDAIMEAIANYTNNDRENVKAFYIDGVGGSGKSFLYETILNVVRGNQQSSIAVAVSGIAATLLTGGQTAHSAFRMPLSIDENTTCNISVQSPEGQRIRDASVIVWDEASMISCHMLSAIDRLFRDIMNTDCPFGGKVIVFGGDFRQILPIVQGSRAQQIEACIKNSPLWRHFRIFKLETNMRAADREGEFSTWVKSIGDGNTEPIEYINENNRVVRCHKSTVEIPGHCICDENIDEWVFDDMTNDEIYKRAVLCPRNVDVNASNERVLERLEGEMRTFYSSHHQAEGPENDEPLLLPLDLMESYNSGSLPSHELRLKVNAIVMLLRNIDVNRGLCNGTRMKVTDIGQNVIKCVVSSGPFVGQQALIGRLSLSANDATMNFKRMQFPLKLSYAMTINKSQGQTFDRIGIYLPIPVFSHGQLYVALSRAKRFEDIKVQIVATRKQGIIQAINKYVTKNIVFPEVL